MHSPGEVSGILQIPASTLRRYVAEYKEFLSPEATQPRNRRFNQTDLGVLAKIRQGLNDGIPSEKIKDDLGTIVEDELEAERALVEYEPINQALTTIRSDVTGIVDEMGKHEDRLSRLEEWLRLPWWKRLFVRPPD